MVSACKVPLVESDSFYLSCFPWKFIVRTFLWSMCHSSGGLDAGGELYKEILLVAHPGHGYSPVYLVWLRVHG